MLHRSSLTYFTDSYLQKDFWALGSALHRVSVLMVVIADRGLHPCGAAINPCRVDGAAGGFGDAGPVVVHGAVVQVGVGAVPQH